MAVIETNPQLIVGPWREGYVLDKHTVSSTPTHYVGEHLQFDTVRTPLGEQVYTFKNRGGPPEDIVDTAADFIAKFWPGKIDAVMTVPPSLSRSRQPAQVLAAGIGKALGLAVLSGAVVKSKATSQMKNVPAHERAVLLKSVFQPGSASVARLSVLIVDDLWETGSTMRGVAEVVHQMGAADVWALAMTRTK